MGVVIGTSGWQYRDWKEIFYADVPQKRWLDHYATIFPAVEVNNTFYNLPKEQTFADWRARAPRGFEFVCKASRYITHIRRLNDVSESVATFLDRAKGLGDKLGPVLYQLPPNMKRDDARLRGFLDTLPQKPSSAVEFRHDSWYADEVYDMLRSAGVALVVADSPKHKTPLVTTTSWSYVRLHHGEKAISYGSEGLALWAARILELSDRADPLYVFFNNDTGGNAFLDALSLTEKVRSAGVSVVAAPAA